MHYSFIVIISSIIYAIVQAGASALLFPRITGLNRRAAYFQQFLWFAAVTLTCILSAQIIFLVYQCRLETIVYKLFGVIAPLCGHFAAPLFLTHATVPGILFFYLAAVVVHYLLIAPMCHLPPDKILTMLLITNACACAAKYMSLLAPMIF